MGWWVRLRYVRTSVGWIAREREGGRLYCCHCASHRLLSSFNQEQPCTFLANSISITMH